MTETSALYRRQTMILEWLKSLGHRVSEDKEIRGYKSKKKYASHSEAQQSASRMRMKVYSCEFCGGFHLTSQGR